MTNHIESPEVTFGQELKKAIPVVSEKTTEKLLAAGISTIEQLAETDNELLTSLHIRQVERNALILFSRARKRLFRYQKGFDSFLDTHDFFWITPALMSAIITFVFGITNFMTGLWIFDIFLCTIGIFLSGLYFLYCLVDRSKTNFLSDLLLIILVMWNARLWILIIGFRYVNSGLETFTFIVFGVIVFAPMAHFLLFKYRNPYNIRQKTIEWMSGAIAYISILYGLVIFKQIIQGLANDTPLSAFEIVILFFALLAFYWLHRFGVGISQRKELPSGNSIVLIYIFAFALVFTNIFAFFFPSNENWNLLGVVNELLLRLIVPAALLSIYVLFPTRYYPKLGVIFVVYQIAWAILSIFSTLPNISLLIAPALLESFWKDLSTLADIIGILGFLGISIPVWRLFTKPLPTGNIQQLQSASLNNAIHEILEWGTGFIAPYQPYWDASNFCFEQAMYDKGIDVAKKGLEIQNLPKYHQGALYYQIACGYALQGEKRKAIETLDLVFKLWVPFKKFAIRDEMLKSIHSDIMVEFF